MLFSHTAMHYMQDDYMFLSSWYFALFSPLCVFGDHIIQALVCIPETASRTEKNIQLCTSTLEHTRSAVVIEFLEAVRYEKDFSSCVSQTSAFQRTSF